MAAINQARPANTTSVRTPLFILGVALALVAFIVMFAFGLLFANKTSTGTMVTVVVAGQPIEARDALTGVALTTASVPSTAVPAGSFTTVTQLAGYSAIVSIPKGMVISPNIVTLNPDQLSTVGASPFLPIPQGWIAITLPTNEQQGVAGYIAQGDYIDIIATVNTQMFALARPRSVTKTVFFGVHVLKVGPAAPVATQGQVQGVSSSITVVMTQCDAAYMNWLLANVTLRYTLQSFKDYGQAESAKAAACSSTDVLNSVGPAAVNERWNFLQGL